VVSPRKATAKPPRRRSADYTPEEVAWLMDPGPSVEELLQQPEPPGSPAPTISMPPAQAPPPWVRGEGLEAFTRGEDHVEFVPPPVQGARRLVVDDEDGRNELVFDPQLGGAIAIHPGAPDPLWPTENCLGRFSPFSTRRIGIRQEQDARYLVAIEQTATEEVERIVAIDPLAPPTLIVEAVNPDEREGWILRTVTESFALGSVTSITLEDAVV
jgi:hypothetical protein